MAPDDVLLPQIMGLPPGVVEVKCGASFCVALTSRVSPDSH